MGIKLYLKKSFCEIYWMFKREKKNTTVSKKKKKERERRRKRDENKKKISFKLSEYVDHDEGHPKGQMIFVVVVVDLFERNSGSNREIN